MSLQVPSYPSSYDVDPITDAYAWIAFLAIDFSSVQGNVILNINRSAEAANSGCSPDSQLSLPLGDKLPSLTQVITDNYEAFQTIRSYIYTKIKDLPAFSGATDVEQSGL